MVGVQLGFQRGIPKKVILKQRPEGGGMVNEIREGSGRENSKQKDPELSVFPEPVKDQ